MCVVVSCLSMNSGSVGIGRRNKTSASVSGAAFQQAQCRTASFLQEDLYERASTHSCKGFMSQMLEASIRAESKKHYRGCSILVAMAK